MKRWWSWGVRGVTWTLVAVALAAAAMGWHLHTLPGDQAQLLLRSLSADHEAMWASVWGPLPPRTQEHLTHASMGWSLWPRPQIHLHDVRWAVPAELSSEGELRIERLSLGLTWASLWTAYPSVHDVRLQGLTGGNRDGRWGLRGIWRVQQARLGPPDAQGARALDWTLDASLHALQASLPEPGADLQTPWLAGRWQGRARWHPARGDEAPHWRDVDLRFTGQAGGQPVPSARLQFTRWLHQPEQQRLAWTGLTLQAQWGEGPQAHAIALHSSELDAGPDSARGTALQGSWKTAAPLSLSWQLESGLPRGRYTALSWPQWRAVLRGDDGTRAGGQLQADLSWLPDRRALRWDALLGEISVQPRGETERQWSLRGQLELGVRASSWQLEGQAHGGVPDAVLWDGPFATEGQWRRWPAAKEQLPIDARLHLSSWWPDRWDAARRSATWPGRWWQALAWPGQWQVHVGQLGWKGLRLSNAEARLTHHDGVVRMSDLRARLWGGQLSASGQWTLDNGQWQLGARVRDAELALLRQTLDERARSGSAPVRQPQEAAQGVWNGTLALSGRQWAVSEWQGQWALEARAGHWQGLDLRAARLAAGASADTPQPSARTEWRRWQAAGTVAGGVAHLDRFHIAHTGWRMAADGTIDLQDGTLALSWSDLVGGRKRGPVLNVSGPWRAPTTHSP